MTTRAPHVGSTREHGLDLLRAAAILAVIAFHAADLSGASTAVHRVFAFGWMGVDLFFVLSGFLIGRQVFKTRVDSQPGFLAEFWTKRWLRTLPLYYVVLFTCAVIKPALFHVPFKGSIWHFATFTQNYVGPRDFVASWSLCVEEQFYLVLPIVVVLFASRVAFPAWGWLVPVAASAATRAVVWWTASARPVGVRFEDQIHWPTHTHLDGLSIGLFLAATEVGWRAWSARAKWTAAAAGLLLWLSTCATFGPYAGRNIWSAVFVYPLISSAFALLVVGVHGIVLPRLIHRGVESIALWSYGGYLWHGLVVRLIDRSSAKLGSWSVQAACFVAATFALAGLTYHLVERPMLAARDRILDARSRIWARGLVRARRLALRSANQGLRDASMNTLSASSDSAGTRSDTPFSA
jgi:peptidoglycan/LPS O-acetylase OafA/YrhL